MDQRARIRRTLYIELGSRVYNSLLDEEVMREKVLRREHFAFDLLKLPWRYRFWQDRYDDVFPRVRRLVRGFTVAECDRYAKRYADEKTEETYGPVDIYAYDQT